ncbi:4629_t:CDS:10 [Ambispora gerdemannii]|uniref:Short/branched chain specific acyl-CoA dehydrogenase, mitochondrial n=1 Tax=Ambispora gerdemannii TaxID=144530 RepID=A0A9N9F139_9GLOM|nr:4629_t:CDS:10 [Ambispora gerdemannii]
MSFTSCLKTKLPTFARRAGIYVGSKPRFFTQTALLRNASVPVYPSLHTLTEEEITIRDTVAKFAQEKILPKVQEMDEKESLDKEILNGLFDQGFMGVETQGKYGGAEGSFMSVILVVEELAKVDPSISVICDVQNTLVNTLFLKYGNDAIKEKYLPQLAANKVGCFCLSEVGAGSDAFSLKTRAEKKDGYYELTGSKMWITNSYEADIFLVFANIDFTQKHRGITCFVVEKDFGVQVAKKESKLGIRASSTCTLNFDGVKVPEENVLGELGKGYKYAIEILNEGRIGISAQMIGLAQGAFDHALPYTLEREQFGQHVGEFQGMQFQFAQIATDIEAARLLTYNAARLKQEGKNFVMEAAMAKLFSSRVAENAASKAIEFMGGVGFTRDYPVEKYYRDAKIGSIYEGTSNIQLQTIAKLIVNKYKS